MMQCESRISDSLGDCYAFYRASAVLSHNKHEFGTVIAESKNKLIIVDNEISREHVYLIPKSRIDRYGGDKQLYINIPANSLKEFEM